MGYVPFLRGDEPESQWIFWLKIAVIVLGVFGLIFIAALTSLIHIGFLHA